MGGGNSGSDRGVHGWSATTCGLSHPPAAKAGAPGGGPEERPPTPARGVTPAPAAGEPTPAARAVPKSPVEPPRRARERTPPHQRNPKSARRSTTPSFVPSSSAFSVDFEGDSYSELVEEEPPATTAKAAPLEPPTARGGHREPPADEREESDRSRSPLARPPGWRGPIPARGIRRTPAPGQGKHYGKNKGKRKRAREQQRRDRRGRR